MNKGLAPGTVRKRRNTLRSFFEKMDAGLDLKNPVNDSDNPKPPKVGPCGLDYATIARILEAMPATRSAKPGAVALPSLTKLRAAVVAYVGLPPGILAQVKATDLALDAGTVRVAGREKGDGVEPRVLPLTAEGREAFRAFHQANAYGPFSPSALNRSFKRAAKRVGIKAGVWLYRLRHSFGEQLYRTTGDLATVGRMMLHAPGSPVTARYAQGANAEVDRAAAQAFSASISSAAVQPAVPNVPAKRARSRKSRIVKHLREVS
jgi:integrase